MSETYEEMKARVRPERFVVERRESGVAQMSRGLGANAERWEEPAIWATVRDRATGRAIGGSIHLNSLTLAIPEGPSGRFPRGVKATDEEIIMAIAGDEPIFGPSAQERLDRAHEELARGEFVKAEDLDAAIEESRRRRGRRS